MENYIVINGKKAELTKEQLIALGIEIKKDDPFGLKEDKYYYINSTGEVCQDFYSTGSLTSSCRYEAANYCSDLDLMRQRALHETLNRLLWRYSMQHGGDEINWSCSHQSKYSINYDYEDKSYYFNAKFFIRGEGVVYFISEKIAKDAVEKVVKPFIKEHPEFEW